MAKKISPELNKKILRFFSAIADETRLKMLNVLMSGPKNVNEVYEFIGKERMTLSAVSHQLKYLEQSGVVVFQRKGREKVFRLSENFCWCILRDAYSHFRGECGCRECMDSKKGKKSMGKNKKNLN